MLLTHQYFRGPELRTQAQSPWPAIPSPRFGRHQGVPFGEFAGWPSKVEEGLLVMKYRKLRQILTHVRI
jgi:hypothetical protein